MWPASTSPGLVADQIWSDSHQAFRSYHALKGVFMTICTPFWLSTCILSGMLDTQVHMDLCARFYDFCPFFCCLVHADRWTDGGVMEDFTLVRKHTFGLFWSQIAFLGLLGRVVSFTSACLV